MKFFANKKTTQKIVITILLIMSFNFIIPKPVKAFDVVGDVASSIGGMIFDPFIALLTTIIDAVFNGVQDFMMGKDGELLFMVDRNETSEYYGPQGGDNTATVELEQGKYDGAYWGLGEYKIPVIRYSPEAIFANKVPVLDANFLKSDMRELPTDNGGKNTMSALRDVVAGWYVAIRMLAIVGLLSVLVYLSIRMMISGVAADKAKYKKMFMDWLVAMCLLFFLHYIMSFAQTISETLVGMISSAGETAINVNVGNGETQFSTNMIGLVRFQVQHVDSIPRATYFILYVMMVFYTVKFTWVYLKRMITMAFLTLIAPLVALTYPIDKVGDGKAQAFDMWLKEYVYNTLVQPLHCLIYTIFSAATVQIAATNPLLAIVIFPCLGYAEKFLKQMLGFNKAGGGTLPSMAGAVGAHALGTVVGNMGKLGKGGGKSAPGKVRTADNSGKRMQDSNTTKNLEGFEASAAAAQDALDFGNNEEFSGFESDNNNQQNAQQGLPQGRENAQGQNPDLEAQQKQWQQDNTEIDPNDAEIMNQFQDIIDDPNASEEDKAEAQENLAFYNDKYKDEFAEIQPEQQLSPEERGAVPETDHVDVEEPSRRKIKNRPYVGMMPRVVTGLAGDAKDGLSNVGRNFGSIARATAAAGGKALYTGAKGATKAFLKAMPAAAVGAATFAAGSVLTGDLSKGMALAGAAAAGTYGATGKAGQATFGKLGERIEEHMGVSGGVRETYDRNRYGSEIAGRQARADKEFANSKEFNEYLKYYYKDSDKRAKAKEAFMDYRKAGITDLDTIRKAYKAEEKINKDTSKVGGRAISRDEMINTVKLDKKISAKAFTEKEVYNSEKDRVANQLFSGNVKNKDAEARRVMETLKAYRNI